MVRRRILIVGSGAREHALGEKLRRPNRTLYYAGAENAGLSKIATRIDVPTNDPAGLARFAKRNRVELTVVGPDQPLRDGIVDVFHHYGLQGRIFGPTQEAAKIEWSKAHAKAVMKAAGIPTAAYDEFTTLKAAREHLLSTRGENEKVVVKADGLMLGKGVFVCHNRAQALDAVTELMQHKKAEKVVIEDFLDGPEFSVHALCDGKRALVFPASVDHKPVGDGDTGGMTGGMGGYAPVPGVTPAMMQRVHDEIIQRLLDHLNRTGTPFRGLLFPGIIWTKTGPKVVEFNARFGDPEAQLYARLMKSDLYPLLQRAARGDLRGARLQWHSGHVANVVYATRGYPEKSESGQEITGVEWANAQPGVKVFQANTIPKGDVIEAMGGRALSVTKHSRTLRAALKGAYKAGQLIAFPNAVNRTDLGFRHGIRVNPPSSKPTRP